MKNKIITMSMLTIASLTFVGCGSSSSSSNTPITPPPATNGGTAFYVDSAVEGVNVTCGSTTSITDANGMFHYEDGKDCQFSIGGILLRTDSGLYQDKVIIEDNIQTAQYLQSMDYDGNPQNGITIHNQTGNIMSQHGVSHVPMNDQDLAENVVMMENSNIGYHGNFVHQQDAQEHLNNTMREHNSGQPMQPNNDNHNNNNNNMQPDTDNHTNNNNNMQPDTDNHKSY